jgi:hypothetical protein
VIIVPVKFIHAREGVSRAKIKGFETTTRAFGDPVKCYYRNYVPSENLKNILR